MGLCACEALGYDYEHFHEHSENIKKGSVESKLSRLPFFCFPGCKASGWRHSAAVPVIDGAFCFTGKLLVDQLRYVRNIGPGVMPLVGARGTEPRIVSFLSINIVKKQIFIEIQ